MTTGTIKKVVSERGFGFIVAEDAKEYFFHRDGLDSSSSSIASSAASGSRSRSSRVPRARARPRSARRSRQEGPPGNGRAFLFP